MFNGWLSFAGTELLNEERVRAYVKELVPTLKMPTICRDEKDLAVLLDDPPYRSPMFDEAPWIDHDDPDTYGFCGAFPLSVTGLTDSTRTAQLLQNTGDGGAVVGRRNGAKEVRVSALLIATDEAALAAGKRWLSAALGGGCDPCEPADLCFLVGTGADQVAMGDYVSSVLPSSILQGPPSYWQAGSGVFTPTNSGQSVDTPQAPTPLPCDEILWNWKITAASVGTTITIETFGEGGLTNTYSTTVPVTGGTFTVSDRGESLKRSWSRLRVTSAPGESVTIESVTMDYRTESPDDACFAKYARQLRKVTCITGPITVEDYEPTNGAMERVEFGFAAEMPHVYGLEQDVLSVTGSQIQINKRDAAVYELDKTVPACTVPKRAALVVDPDCKPIPLPPRSNVAVSSCAPDPDYLHSYALAIPDALIPLWSEAVPIMSIRTNSAAARKVQVRFMPQPFPGQTPVDLDPCSACGEFVIDYIPPHSTFVLNGMEEKAYIKQSGNRISDGGHLLSGMTSTTLFRWPVLTCGTGYLAIIDMAATGVGGFDLSIAVRE